MMSDNIKYDIIIPGCLIGAIFKRFSEKDELNVFSYFEYDILKCFFKKNDELNVISYFEYDISRCFFEKNNKLNTLSGWIGGKFNCFLINDKLSVLSYFEYDDLKCFSKNDKLSFYIKNVKLNILCCLIWVRLNCYIKIDLGKYKKSVLRHPQFLRLVGGQRFRSLATQMIRGIRKYNECLLLNCFALYWFLDRNGFFLLLRANYGFVKILLRLSWNFVPLTEAKSSIYKALGLGPLGAPRKAGLFYNNSFALVSWSHL